MSYPIYIAFGLAPSIIWLLFYLRKDSHPESNRMVLKIFLYGMMAAFPAVFLEIGIHTTFTPHPFSTNGWWVGWGPSLISLLNIFIGVALVEEVLKYLIVREKVISNPEFDEPLDAMLYMIIGALGFAAVENVLILLPLGPSFDFFRAFGISGFRFVGATFLHALCSGLIGYFLALSLFETKSRVKLIIAGLGMAVVLHGLYNFSIMKVEGNLKFVIPVIILISLTLFVSYGFRKLKKLRSVCKIK